MRPRPGQTRPVAISHFFKVTDARGNRLDGHRWRGPPIATLLELQAWTLTRETQAGHLTLLRDIDLTIQTGEWLGILGANGSGKTSLLRYLAGEESPLAGRTAMVFQDPDEGLVAGSVTEELSLGRPDLTGANGREKLAEILSNYHLQRYARLAPHLLSAGQKQRLAVAVALAGKPDLLLCDEPTALQDQEHAAWVLQHLRSWWYETGKTVLYATQRRAEAFLADRLILLQDGRIAAVGPCAEVLSHPEAVRLVGAEPLAIVEASAGAGGQVVTEASIDVKAWSDQEIPCGPSTLPSEPVMPVAVWEEVGCWFNGTEVLFQNVSLVIPPGARVGLTGPNGCGKSTLLAMAVGWRPPDQGRCYLRGRPLCDDGKADLDHGAALLAPQFPEYLFTRSSVADEVSLDAALDRYGSQRLLAAVGLPVDLISRNPHELSSGQKRRLALALVILSGRPLLLFDEPTAGLDRPGCQQVQELLAQVPARTSIVVASHDPAFLRECSLPIYVLGQDGLRQLIA